MKKHLIKASVLACSAAISLPAVAANDAMLDLLKVLRDNGTIDEATYSILINSAKSDDEINVHKAQEVAKQEVEAVAGDMPKITTEGKFKIESADGQHSFQPIGRIFWDYNWEDSDGNMNVAGGGELRRARLGFQAQFFKNWKAKLEYDFSGSDADLKDGWISYNNKFAGGQSYNVKVGQHHVPFGFNTISSSKYMSFMRRPLFADGPLSPARDLGVAFRVDDDRWFLHTGFFIEEPGDGATNVTGDTDDDQKFGIRVGGTPWMQDKTHLLHVGASYLHVDTQDNGLRVRQRLVTHLDNGRSLDTGTVASADDVNGFDVEGLVVYGPFHALAEYVYWDVDAMSDYDLSAWSLEAGWFLTGESMKYKQGQFSGISPKRPFMSGGLGAWQLAARVESMDLNDGGLVAMGGALGGEADVFTAGLNWYPIKNVRFMADYTKVLDFERPGDPADSTEPSVFAIRSQVYW